MAFIPTLLTLLFIGIVLYFAFWAIDAAGIPAPFNWMAKGIVLILGLSYLFGGSGVELPVIRF